MYCSFSSQTTAQGDAHHERSRHCSFAGTPARVAANRFDLSKRAVHRAVTRYRTRAPTPRHGRSPRLTETEEATLAAACRQICSEGAPISRTQLKSLCRLFINGQPRHRQRSPQRRKMTLSVYETSKKDFKVLGHGL